MKLIKLLFTFFAFSVSAQQEILAKFAITESTENGRDNTAFDLERGGYFVVYKKDSETFLANVASVWNQQSYGKLYQLKAETIAETQTQYKTDIFNFRWKFYNSYDDETGYATIKMIKIYKPQGIIFNLEMILPNLDVLTYHGYMESSLNFNDFEK